MEKYCLGFEGNEKLSLCHVPTLLGSFAIPPYAITYRFHILKHPVKSFPRPNPIRSKREKTMARPAFHRRLV
jgi:hypothetical protein